MGERAVNEELFEYGIQTETSDIRAHVSVVNSTIYVFPTSNGVAAIKREHPILRPAFQDGVDGATAIGWLVKTDWIEDLRRVKFFSWEGWKEFNKELPTDQKGALAVKCDYRGGDLPLGTGNLFLQKAERNPLKKH